MDAAVIVAKFPESWKTEVTVHRGGGHDRKGNPLPTTDHQVVECMIGWRSTDDPVDRSDLVTDKPVLYADDPMADFQTGDQVTIPVGPWPSGDFWLDGSPKRWPLGCEVPLARGDARGEV